MQMDLSSLLLAFRPPGMNRRYAVANPLRGYSRSERYWKPLLKPVNFIRGADLD